MGFFGALCGGLGGFYCPLGRSQVGLVGYGGGLSLWIWVSPKWILWFWDVFLESFGLYCFSICIDTFP